jgi:hypothetical protein
VWYSVPEWSLPERKFPIGIPIGKIPIRIWDKIPIGIPIGKIPIGIFSVLVLCTQVNMMFVMLL